MVFWPWRIKTDCSRGMGIDTVPITTNRASTEFPSRGFLVTEHGQGGSGAAVYESN